MEYPLYKLIIHYNNKPVNFLRHQYPTKLCLISVRT